MAKAQTIDSTVQKFTSIDILEQTERGPVYVTNNLKGDYKGMILIPISRRNGNGHDVVRVASTFIPQDVTAQVGKAQLMDSPEFRQAVGKGLIRLIDPKYAAIVMQSEEAQAELTKISGDMARAKMMVESTLLNGAGSSSENEMLQSEDEAQELLTSLGTKSQLTEKQQQTAIRKERIKEDMAEASQPTVNNKLKMRILAAVDQKSTQSEVIAMLRNETLDETAIRYAAKQFGRKEKVMDFLKKELAKLKAKKAK